MPRHKKTLIVTTRVDFDRNYNEFRDGIDQRLVRFLSDLDFNIFLMPNYLKNPLQAVSQMAPAGIVLSGGNDILYRRHNKSKTSVLNGSLQRDRTEFALIRYCRKNNVPLFGICRGMQMINVAFRGSLIQDLSKRKGRKINHVVSVHAITLKDNFILDDYKNKIIRVNSFHNQGISEEYLAKDLISMAYSEDGLTEALLHKKYPVMGIQWHPERRQGSLSLSRRLFREFFR